MEICSIRKTMAEVESVTGVPANTLRTWYQRGVLFMRESDSSPAGEGLPRYVSGFSILQIAITGYLVRNLDMSPKRAATAAAYFAHVGDNDGVMQRMPGELWPGSVLTILIIPPSEGEVVANVARVDTHRTAFDLLVSEGLMSGGVVLPLNDIVHEVRKRLYGGE